MNRARWELIFANAVVIAHRTKRGAIKAFRWWRPLPVSEDTVCNIVVPQEITDRYSNYAEVVAKVQAEKYFSREILSSKGSR